MVFLDIHVTQSRPIYCLNVPVSWILFNTRRLLLFKFLVQRFLSLIEWAFIWAACVSIIRPHLEFCNAEGLINPVAGALISYIKIFVGAHFLIFHNIVNASVTCDQVKILWCKYLARSGFCSTFSKELWKLVFSYIAKR